MLLCVSNELSISQEESWNKTMKFNRDANTNKFAVFFVCLFLFFNQMFSLFTFQMLPHFLVSPPKTPSLSLPHAHQPLNPLPYPGIPLHWGIKPSQDQRPLFSLMSDKAIFCYTCGWSHGSLHAYSLVGGLFPGSTGGTGQFILLFLLWGYKPLQLLGYFLQLLH